MTKSEYYERYYNWYKLTICKIANADDQANPIAMKEFAQSALDVDSAELKIWLNESEELKSKGIYSSRHHGVKDAEYSLGIDGEPTTADEYNETYLKESRGRIKEK
jgi:hypothetical protein|tara:strand:+ start:5551 stop:5868 length:318 start_codon:yes stop_codon:yes gene_type:complete